jgi:uncharacterized MAPEG superfamily protein
MVVFQALVAARAHRKQEQYIPGVVDAQLDHHSFVFRSHRTFLNSLENVPLFVLTAMVAIAANVEAYHLFTVALVFAIARFIHMVLFYKIATNANPSPRSYFYLIGLIAQIYLLGLIFWTL